MMTINNHQFESTVDNRALGLYIHIPFCASKCLYCDFLSFGVNESGIAAAGLAKVDLNLQQQYVQALIGEIKNRGFELKGIVDSIFIGGGTPSILEAKHIAEILEAAKTSFFVSEDCEITIEANPGTLTMDKLRSYLGAGINRISIGVQAFNDLLLGNLGRIHTAKEAAEAFTMAREAGFKNINLDLMFAIPGQDMDIWKETLDTTINLRPEHISFYSLQIEEGTPFFKAFQSGTLSEIPDEEDRAMYHEALALLKKAGYEHYEISNVALPGKACRHNIKYWSFEEYLGLGLGAHSFIGRQRFSNLTDLEAYILETWVESKHDNTAADSAFEYVFTGLRKIEGVNYADFKAKLGLDFSVYYSAQVPMLEHQAALGNVQLSPVGFRLTEKGIDVSNSIMAEFA